MTVKRVRKLEASNVGPIHSFTAEVRPGMNLLTAANGSGKSCLLSAIARAAGQDVSVEVRDGATKAQIVLDGTVLLALTRSKSKADPTVETSLASVSPLAAVIDPGIKDVKARENARMKALLSLFDLQTTPETISELVGGDESALDWMNDSIGIADFCELDPVTAAAKVSQALHKRKRELEDESQKAHGRWLATAPKEKPERLSELSVRDAEMAYDKLVGDHRELSGEASQRIERERERATIEATLGARPNYESAKAEADAEWQALNTSTSERTRLEAQIAELQRELAGVVSRQQAQEASAKRAQDHANSVLEAGRAWDQRKAVLDAPITGATLADVENASLRVKEARQALELARATESYRKALEASEDARSERERYTQLAARYEVLAKAVSSRLGGLLSQAGVEGITVEDGALTVIHPDGSLEAFARLSTGQRARMAIPWWIRKNPSRLASFPEEFWQALEAESKREIADLLVEFDIVGLCEVASKRGDPLHVEHFDGEA